MPDKINYHGNKVAARTLRNLAYKQLDILKNHMSFAGLQQYGRRVVYDSGVEIYVTSAFGYNVLNVFVPLHTAGGIEYATELIKEEFVDVSFVWHGGSPDHVYKIDGDDKHKRYKNYQQIPDPYEETGGPFLYSYVDWVGPEQKGGRQIISFNANSRYQGNGYASTIYYSGFVFYDEPENLSIQGCAVTTVGDDQYLVYVVYDNKAEPGITNDAGSLNFYSVLIDSATGFPLAGVANRNTMSREVLYINISGTDYGMEVPAGVCNFNESGTKCIIGVKGIKGYNSNFALTEFTFNYNGSDMSASTHSTAVVLDDKVNWEYLNTNAIEYGIHFSASLLDTAPDDELYSGFTSAYNGSTRVISNIFGDYLGDTLITAEIAVRHSVVGTADGATQYEKIQTFAEIVFSTNELLSVPIYDSVMRQTISRVSPNGAIAENGIFKVNLSFEHAKTSHLYIKFLDLRSRFVLYEKRQQDTNAYTSEHWVTTGSNFYELMYSRPLVDPEWYEMITVSDTNVEINAHDVAWSPYSSASTVTFQHFGPYEGWITVTKDADIDPVTYLVEFMTTTNDTIYDKMVSEANRIFWADPENKEPLPGYSQDDDALYYDGYNLMIPNCSDAYAVLGEITEYDFRGYCVYDFSESPGNAATYKEAFVTGVPLADYTRTAIYGTGTPANPTIDDYFYETNFGSLVDFIPVDEFDETTLAFPISKLSVSNVQNTTKRYYTHVKE